MYPFQFLRRIFMSILIVIVLVAGAGNGAGHGEGGGGDVHNGKGGEDDLHEVLEDPEEEEADEPKVQEVGGGRGLGRGLGQGRGRVGGRVGGRGGGRGGEAQDEGDSDEEGEAEGDIILLYRGRKNDLVYECFACFDVGITRTFQSLDKLGSHYNWAHNNMTLPIKCKTCGNRFPNKNRKREHGHALK